MGSLVEARLGADDALAWLVSQPQAKLAVDLCLVGRVRVCENGQDVGEHGDDGCDLVAGHERTGRTTITPLPGMSRADDPDAPVASAAYPRAGAEAAFQRWPLR